MKIGWVGILTVALLCLVPGQAVAKKKPAPARVSVRPKPVYPAVAAPAPQMTGDQKVLHALNRLTFGPRPGDADVVRAAGLDQWIEAQLNPETTRQNPLLESKLAPFDSLRMTTAELVRHYPTPQMVKLMVEGKLAFPDDPQTRYSVEKLIARYKRRESADKAGQPADAELNSPDVPATWQLDDQQRQILQKGKPPEQAALLAGFPPAEQLDVLDTLPNGVRQRLYGLVTPDLRRRIQIFNGPVQVVNQDLMEAKILRATYSDRQLEEILTDFWFNHFNVNLDKGADRYAVTAYERDAIRPHVLGHFRDLLLATAQSPAMLFYLDNWQSAGPDPRGRRKQGLNENYGRELMELHTLGVDGGYTQLDVTEVARCFTGWTVREPNLGGDFEFDEKRHDEGEKHVLGVTIPAGGGIEDGMKVLDILSHNPSTAHFIAKSLAIRFVSDDPPEALVKKMADTFNRTDGDLREVMRTMLHAPEFWLSENYRAKVKSPFEMMVSALRAVHADIDYAQALTSQLNQLGEPLYRKLEPTGYSNRGADWMNSASLLARLNFAQALTQNRVNGVKVDQTQFSLDASRLERSLLSTDPSKAVADGVQAGLDHLQQAGALAAGLTLGSPDFQRR